jgi:hypothetical protein
MHSLWKNSKSVADKPLDQVHSPSELAAKMDQEIGKHRTDDDLFSDLEVISVGTNHRGDAIAELNDLLGILNGFSNALLGTPKSKDYKHSRIRVQLSRPLTVAEAEKLTSDHHTISGRLNVSRREDDGFLFKLRVSPNRTHVWVDADLPSRDLYEVVASALDSHFVNVYPTAVRTFTEYHA